MVIIGCDYHPSGQQVFGIDTESGEVVADRWIAHTGKEVEQFYGAWPAGTVVGVESSGNMLWFERLLAQYGHQLRLGDAAKIRTKETRKQKHDRRDAELIARLLREGSFPDLQWVPKLEERDQRQLADAPAQAGADAGASEESVAAYCHEPGAAKETAVVDQGGTRTAGEVAARALDSTPAERFVALARPPEPRLREPGDGGRAGGGGAGRRAAADDASRGGTGDQPGVRADHRRDRTLRAQPAAGELSGSESVGGFQWRAAAAGRDQQTGQ